MQVITLFTMHARHLAVHLDPMRVEGMLAALFVAFIGMRVFRPSAKQGRVDATAECDHLYPFTDRAVMIDGIARKAASRLQLPLTTPSRQWPLPDHLSRCVIEPA